MVVLVANSNTLGIDARTFFTASLAFETPICVALGVLLRVGVRWRWFHVAGLVLCAALAVSEGLAAAWVGVEPGVAGVAAFLILMTLTLTWRMMIPWMIRQRELSEGDQL